MEIYFVRHGAAEGSLYNTPEADFERELTKYGRDTVTSGAECLKNFVPGFDLILTSPLVRAVQTAEIFAAPSTAAPPLEEAPPCSPPAP
jgi:phosphohistidine phosphatase